MNYIIKAKTSLGNKGYFVENRYGETSLTKSKGYADRYTSIGEGLMIDIKEFVESESQWAEWKDDSDFAIIAICPIDESNTILEPERVMKAMVVDGEITFSDSDFKEFKTMKRESSISNKNRIRESEDMQDGEFGGYGYVAYCKQIEDGETVCEGWWADEYYGPEFVEDRDEATVFDSLDEAKSKIDESNEEFADSEGLDGVVFETTIYNAATEQRVCNYEKEYTFGDYSDEDEDFDEEFEESKKDNKNRVREAYAVSSNFNPNKYSKEELGDTSELIPASIRALFEGIIADNKKRVRG